MLVDFDSISQNINKIKYPLIGSGSGRNVYDLGNGYVVKKARNHKGIAQNEAEYRIYNHSHSELLANIIGLSDDNIYLVMEKAEKLRSMSDVWRYYRVSGPKEFFRSTLFLDAAERYHLLPNDLYRKTSWGMINGKPVVIDYGFTRETRRFYTMF
jgi:hypothetical protein